MRVVTAHSTARYFFSAEQENQAMAEEQKTCKGKVGLRMALSHFGQFSS